MGIFWQFDNFNAINNVRLLILLLKDAFIVDVLKVISSN